MRFPDGHRAILAVRRLGARSLRIYKVTRACIDVRLAAACYAAARAAHYLDKVVILFAALDRFKKLAGVCRAMNDGDVDVHTVYVDGRFLYAVKSANSIILNAFDILAGENVRNRTQSSLHNAARYAEYYSGAGGVAENGIKLLVGEVCVIYARLTDHPRKLARREVGVNVPIAVAAHLGTGYLILLGSAGHYGHHEYLMRIETVLLTEVCLCDSSLHLVRALAGREIWYELRVEMLAVAYPAGAAGGYHRQYTAVLNPVDKLCTFLHNRKVGAEIDVKHLVGAEAAHCRNKLARCGRTYREAEFFTDCDTHCGSGLEYYIHVGILKSIPYSLCGILFRKSACRACGDALTAVDAGGFGEALAERNADFCLEAAVLHTDCTDALRLFAGGDTAAAKDALVVIPHNARRKLVDSPERTLAVKFYIGNAELFGKRLKLTVVVTLACEAGAVVIREDQLKHSASCVKHLRRSRFYFQSFRNGENAGSLKLAALSVLNKTHAACADVIDVLEIAQRGDLDAVVKARLQYGLALFTLNGFAIDFECNHYPKSFLYVFPASSGVKRYKASIGSLIVCYIILKAVSTSINVHLRV